MSETKLKILDAAERLVADHGLDVSLRAITAEAGVNLAAVNYHFQSKDALIDALIARRIEPVNVARLKMLDELDREFPTGRLPLERVIEALVAPVLDMDAAEHIRIIFGRLYSLPDEFLKRVFTRHLQPIVERFRNAFERAIPELSFPERMACMLLTIGAMVQVLTWSRLLTMLSNGTLTADNPGDMTNRIVNFASAGFRAALEQEQNKNRGSLHA